MTQALPTPDLARSESTAPPPLVFSKRFLLAMLVMGYIPFVHAAASVTFFILAGTRSAALFLPLALVMLYLVPAVVVRVFTFVLPLPTGRLPLNSRPFLRWWFTAQWQIVFNRLRFLEEFLRLVPGLYSLWLRIWGARVGKLVYWSPGLEILDRPLLDIGDQVVFGMGVRLNAHAIMPDADTKQPMLQIAPIRLGARSLIGGYSVVLAGVVVAPGEQTPAMRPLLPFTHFKDRHRHDAATEAP